MPAIALKRSNRINLNHGLHAVLTLASLGLWLPVWTWLCLRNEGWKSRYNWTVAGRSHVGLQRIERLDLELDQLHRLAR